MSNDGRMWFEVRLRQDPRVAALGSTVRPYGNRDTLRSALGIVDDVGEVDVVLVRDSDPQNVADHKLYWPMTIADRWRFARDGIMLADGRRVTPEQRALIRDAVRNAIEAATEPGV